MIKNSYIESLHVREVGLFKELNIHFNQQFNFIIGPNGSGKTSILRCIAIILNPDKVSVSRYGNNSELWTDIVFNEKKIRIGVGKGWVTNEKKYRGAQIRQLIDPPKDRSYKISLNSYFMEDNRIFFAPLFIGAYRHIAYKSIDGIIRENDSVTQRKFYRKIGVQALAGSYLPGVKQWMINRYYNIEKEWAEIERVNWNWLLNNFKEIGPKNSDFDFVDIKRDLEPLFSFEGTICYLEELSAGLQAILSLIFAIFDWIEGINDNDDRVAKNAKGTVIIDELDIHMHPEWQFTIRNTLQKLFPNLQFITTTHSPHLIKSAKPNEIIILPKLNRFVNEKPSPKSYSGWTTDQILEDIMDVKSLKETLYVKFYEEALKSIGEKNSIKLKDLISKLEKIAHPSDTIIERLKIELASLLLE